MRNHLSIVSGINTEELCRSLVKIINADKINTIYSENSGGGRFFFEIEASSPIPHGSIAEYISDWIVSNYELRIMEELFDEYFNEFDEKERSGIICSAKEKIGSGDRAYINGLICRKLSAYLHSESVLSIDGFVRFRLTEYRRELEFLLIDAADDFFREREYDEFVGMMSEYVNLQLPLAEMIHIVPRKDGGFSLYDFRKLRIKVEFETMPYDLLGVALSDEDRLIEILMTLTPRRIVWHESGECETPKLLMTLEQIFGKRLSRCFGCELCCETH